MSDLIMHLCEILIYPCVAIWLFCFVYLLLRNPQKSEQIDRDFIVVQTQEIKELRAEKKTLKEINEGLLIVIKGIYLKHPEYTELENVIQKAEALNE